MTLSQKIVIILVVFVHFVQNYTRNTFRDDFFQDLWRQARAQRTQKETYSQNYRNYSYSSKSSGRGYSHSYYSQSSHFNVPPSFQTNDLPAAKRWLNESRFNVEEAQTNFDSDHVAVAAYMSRMVGSQN